MRGHFTKGWCTVLISWWLSIAASGQDYNYVQYGTRDGLAGSTVYDMCQDQDGFIWFATENGLSRYDGTRFKTYTVKDGLPDNEVLLLHADKKGRVWVGTFNKEVCYIEAGKIRTKQNDALVKKLRLETFVAGFLEDALGNLYLSDRKHVFIVRNDNSVLEMTKHPPFSNKKYGIVFPCFMLNDRELVVRLDDSVFVCRNNQLSFLSKWSGQEVESSFRLNVRDNSPTISLPSENVLIRLTPWKGASIFAATSAGAWEIDTLHHRLGNRFLKN